MADIDPLSQLEAHANALTGGVKLILERCRDAGINASTSGTPSLPVIPSDAPAEIHRQRQTLLASAMRLQTLLSEPEDFVQNLAKQNQLLACIQWLGEFQVLACIPLSGSVPARDVADLAGVSESQLRRVVRMTATAGFLQEPQPEHIAHTALSAPFVTKLAYLDAAVFLAETAAPSALHMAAATQRHGHSGLPADSAYSLAFNTTQTFQSACEQRVTLQRQWPAYLRCTGDADGGVTELLTRLDWLSLGSTCIVDVGATSTRSATALAELYPALRFVVQMTEGVPRQSVSPAEAGKLKEFSHRITLQTRVPGTLQPVKDAAVYIVRLTSPSPAVSSQPLASQILSELRAHLEVLRSNPSSMLVLVLRALPEPGTVDPDVEAMARLRDLSLMQLANERELELGELADMVNSAVDGVGKLFVVNKLRSRSCATVALGVKYQAFVEGS